MQHYTDIQTSYDNENQERLQANICSEFWSKGPISFKRAYFTQEKQYKQKQIKYDWNKKYNQFTQEKSPTKNMLEDENAILNGKSNSQQFSQVKTSASSGMKNNMI